MTERDRKFAEEYMIDLNAYAAAMRAGYSPATARNAAAWIKREHPRKPKVRDLIDGLMAERSRRTGITAERVLDEIGKIAFANPGDVVDFETGKVRPDAKREDLAAITKVRVKRGEISEYEVTLADKGQYLRMAGQHLGMFSDSVKIDGAVPVIVDDG